MRKRVIAGNWKMNKNIDETKEFIDAVVQNLPKSSEVDAVICAPFPYLPTIIEKAKGTMLKVAAQNMHFEENGAYTGEVSPVMLTDIGVTHVIIGHSERREHFAETNEMVQLKTKAAHKHGLVPIVCVGESLQQREAGETKAHIEEQVKIALSGLTDSEIKDTIIAYEPIWAIGTGKTATSEQANSVCASIRDVVATVSNQAIADEIIIQYGGSVNPENISDLLAQSDIDGALVGGASLEAKSFIQLVEVGVQ